MRIEATDARKRQWDHLTEATGENAKSKALDTATMFYLRMRGDTAAYPDGRVTALLKRAENEGSLTAQEIAEELDTPELPVSYSSSRSVGRK